MTDQTLAENTAHTVPKSPWRLLLIAAGLALSLAAGAYWHHQATQAEVNFDCRDATLGCALPMPGATLRFSVPPHAAAPFDVVLDGVNAERVTIRFAMAGMEMGGQPLVLTSRGRGRWSVQAWLPFCSQGRRDWLAVVEVDQRRYRFAFASGR